MIKRQIDDELLSFFKTANHEALLIDWLQESGVALSCPVATEARVPLRLTQNSNFFLPPLDVRPRELILV